MLAIANVLSLDYPRCLLVDQTVPTSISANDRSVYAIENGIIYGVYISQVGSFWSTWAIRFWL